MCVHIYIYIYWLHLASRRASKLTTFKKCASPRIPLLLTKESSLNAAAMLELGNTLQRLVPSNDPDLGGHADGDCFGDPIIAPQEDHQSVNSIKLWFQICEFIKSSGWWFGTFLIFPYTGNNHPSWLSYFSEGWPNHQPVMICARAKMGQLWRSQPWRS